MKAWVERDRGRWRVRAALPSKSNEVGKRTIGFFDDELAARRMAKAWNEKAEEGVAVAVTLADWLNQWFDRREKNGSAGRETVRGIDAERSIAARHIFPAPIASAPIQEVSRADVEDYALWLRKRKKVDTIRTSTGSVHRERLETISAQTQRHAMRLVRQCLSDAVGRVIEVNPADEVSVGKGRKADLSDDWLRAGELETLLSSTQLSLRDRTVYACAVGLGLRLNDLKLLRVEDVHLNVDVPGPHVIANIHKSEKVHKVPVLPWLLPWLRAHLETLPMGTIWLFPMEDGTHYSKSYDFGWAKRFERLPSGDKLKPSALHRAGIARKIRFHDLRGTTATHLALGTWGRAWTLNEIQQFLAHSDQRVTERYVRRANDALAEAAKATTGGSFHPGGPPSSRVNPLESLPRILPRIFSDPLRIPRDSNARPSAPEADALSN